MASWEDGAEYAPIERPDGFAMPEAEPLPAPDPYTAATPGPGGPPEQYQPAPTGVRLDALVPTDVAPRNPGEPFAVASATMTTESAWDAARRPDSSFAPTGFDPRTPFATGRAVQTADFPPPTQAPLQPDALTGHPLSQQRPGPPAPYQPGPGPFVNAQPTRPVGTTTPAQRTLVLVGCGLIVLALLVPATMGVSMLVASGLFLRAMPGRPGPGVAAVLTAIVLLAAQLVGDELPPTLVLIGQGVGIGILVAAGLALRPPAR